MRGSPVSSRKPTRAELEAENERLHAEVERLDHILHPPPPPPPEPEPAKPRVYVLAEGERSEPTAHIALEHAQKQWPEADCVLAWRLEDIPEDHDTCFVLANHIVISGFSDDPLDRQVRWFRRKGDKIQFALTRKQSAAFDHAARRLADARWVLLDRHRDDLPKFEVADEIKGTDAAMTAYDEWRERTKPLEDAITVDLHKASDAASHSFYRGETSWLATINDAIAAAGISEAEIQAKQAQLEAREAEVARMLAEKP